MSHTISLVPRRPLGAAIAAATSIAVAATVAVVLLSGVVGAHEAGVDASHVVGGVYDHPLPYRPDGPVTVQQVAGHDVRREVLRAADGRWLRVDAADATGADEVLAALALDAPPAAVGGPLSPVDGEVGAARPVGAGVVVVIGGGGATQAEVDAVAGSARGR